MRPAVVTCAGDTDLKDPGTLNKCCLGRQLEMVWQGRHVLSLHVGGWGQGPVRRGENRLGSHRQPSW